MAEANNTVFTLGRIRKAVVAGFGAGAAAVFAAVTTGNLLADGKIDATEAGGLVGAFFASFVAIGYATFATPNKADRHASKDAATMAAVQQVQNLALPPLTAADIAATSSLLPADPTPENAAQGRHEA